MPDSWIQEQNRLKQRRKQKNLSNTSGAPFLGVITGSHKPDTEKVITTYAGGERNLRTLHPYVGADSWIRVGAEAGVPVIMAQRVDSNEPEILAYAFREAETRTTQYSGGGDLYRPLTPGEIELHSKGLAQTYYSRRPILDQRGGLIRTWLDQDALENGAKAPLHTRQLHLYSSSGIGDEERFGVVNRPLGAYRRLFVRAARVPDPILTGKTIAAGVTSGIIPQPGPWAKEHTRVLKSGALFPPILMDVREGDVIDDFGIPVMSTLSGLPLRYKGEWFCDSPLGGAVFVGIDQMGNVNLALPTEAVTGLDVKIAIGDFTVSVGKNHSITAQLNYSVATTAGKMAFDSMLDFEVTSKTGAFKATSMLDVSLESQTGNLAMKAAINGSIDCVDMAVNSMTGSFIKGADSPMVRGLDLKLWIEATLLAMFNAHIHPTGVGPSGPPVPLLTPPPPTAWSLFAKVK